MEQNPYESPRVPDKAEEQFLGDPGSIRQLLIEIRDAQLEMLRLTREAQQRARAGMWYRPLLALIPLLIVLPFLYYSLMARQRIIQQLPPRPAPRALP
jgi:hypothetical protein